MADNVGKKFEDWTKGLTLEESMVRIFENIRDIPYYISPELFDRETGPRKMLVQNRGFCNPKHYLMGMMFERLGMKVRYWSCSFRWDEMRVDCPEEIKEAAKRLPYTYHLACHVEIGHKWVLVDATWDKTLLRTGFPVNLEWDGRNGMRPAVIPIKEFVHKSASERESEFIPKIMAYTAREKLSLARFATRINAWLNDVRSDIEF